MRKLAGMIAVVVMCVAVPSAGAANTNLLANGTFEGSGSGSLTGWKGSNATLSIVTGDGGGFGARVTQTTGTTFSIVTSSKVVTSTSAGTAYVADGRFNAPSGKTVCLKLKEAGTQSSSGSTCAAGTGGWASLPELSYTALASGDNLTFSVLQKHAVSGDAFVVDNLSVTTGGGGGGGIDPPSGLSATAVSSSEIDLSWTPSSTSTVTAYNIFRDGGAQPIASVPASQTTYKNTGLQAGHTYSYTVDATDGTTESAMSNSDSATTSGGGGGGVTIAAAGDIACSPNDPNYNGGAGTGSLTSGHCWQAATANLIGQGSYDRVLPLGDNQYDCGDLTSYNAVYDKTWGAYNSIAEPVPGNHEASTTSSTGDTGCTKAQTGYFTYFANHGVTDAAGVGGKGYYSYDVGGWHVIAINSNCGPVGGCGVGSPQETWLKTDLAGHPAQCTMAYWHEAAWSSTGSNGTLGVASMRPIWADLENAGVDLVLAGHFHHYERFAELNASGQPVANGQGTREIIAGMGGESEGNFGTTTAPGSQVRMKGFGILALTLGSGSYSWQYIQVGGAVKDSGTDNCHS